ncbi:MAG: hypothetical protein HY046_11485 [Acidobacteria bacterium]|nr:hypothetical protein [Acidobacteriota bacterium]
MTNRNFLRAILAATISASLAVPSRAAELTPREAALEAAKWIRGATIRTEIGAMWPADPRDSESVNHSLYAGTPGIVLFFLEAYRATGDKSYLADARAGANTLLRVLRNETEKGSGFYEGIAGLGFALAETYKVTGDQDYQLGVLEVIQTLYDRAKNKGDGLPWGDSTDIISGTSGTGLILLDLYRGWRFIDPRIQDLAVKAGNRLLKCATAENGGLRWAMDDKFPRLMPNFSHGTAGVAYFLATLYQETKQKKFLAAALAGAKYLQSIAETEGNVCLIYHDTPDNKKLYYLGWCHGPVGTARLFYRLYQITKGKQWLDWTEKSARGVLSSGIPEKQTPGFWNNVSQCCGSAGVAEFALEMYRVTHKREYLDFARRVTANLMSRATRDERGMRWVQAEHRVQPDLLVAQTGYMQGAAGIGMWLLHLDEFERGQKPAIRFPDSPW